MKKSSVPLVVFTDNYPFDVGEEFFEQEINYLAERFTEVWVVPMRVGVGASKTRLLPENVSAVLLPLEDARGWKQRVPWYLPRLVAGPGRVELGNTRRSAVCAVRELHFAVDALHRFELFTRTRLYRERLVGRPLIAYGYWLYYGAAMAQMLRATHDAPVAAVSRAHAYDVNESYKPQGHLPARRRLVEGLDEVYPISQYAASFLTPYLSAGGARLDIRHLGVPASGRGERTREPIHIVSCSHLAPYKRIDRLADAVGALSERGRRVRWTHIGERDEQRLEAMREYAARVAPKAKIEFLGYLPNDRTRSLLETAGYTVLVNSSAGEGVPVSVMEAMAAGIPVVATDVGGTKEIVHDGVNGVLAPAQATGEELADAIAQAVDASPDDFRRMCEQAVLTWDEEFNAERQYRGMARRLVELAEGLRQGAAA
ncbi:glycosyltransferase [Actinomyces qiguomingii]|uniref:glycosyltransferase n=1 Tax=Actinomyces qiguomingii TaxID=2057800 RepID=UPI000CA03AF1|nr:glycosyltransferase [Actinomyces qiguomingii]